MKHLLNFLAARLRSVGHALDGLRYLLRTQRNAWIHLAASIVVCALGTTCRLAVVEWCWIIAAMAAVWAAEALNTALELLADATCPQHHKLVGHAKDVAAAAVLLAALGAATIGTCIFLRHLLLLA